MSTIGTYKAKKLRPIHDHVLVTEMEFSERFTSGGILLPGDDTKSAGIRPRWGKIIAVGPEQKDVKVGEYILVAHGRWTRGIRLDLDGEEVTVRRVDNNDILLVSDVPQNDDTMSNAVEARSDRSVIEGSLHRTHLSE